MSGNYPRIMSGNYPRIMGGNYHLVYHHLVYHDDAEKLRFIGILAYPKTYLKIVIKNVSSSTSH